MTETSPIRFAIIGAGHIGMRHAEMIRKNKDLSLLAVCDSDAERLQACRDWGLPLFLSLDAMLSEVSDFDVLSIASPNGMHAEHAISGLKAGKHVLIEKPMALKSGDCRQIIQLSEKQNRKVFCVMQNRYSPPSVWLKSLLTEGKLGKLYQVQVNCFWNRDKRYYTGKTWRGSSDLDGGTLFTQFSHFVDMLYWLFGDMKNFQARFRDNNYKGLTEFEDSAAIIFDFENGALGSMQYSTSVWDTNMESSMTVIAEKGTVKIGGQYMNKVEYCHIENYEMPQLKESEPANDYGSYKGSASNHGYVYGNIAEVLKSGTAITTNASDGMKVVEIIESIYSLKQN